MKALRFLIVDDAATYRHILHELIEDQPHESTIIEADNGLEAISLAVQHRPDVVMIGVNLPVMNGIAATQQIKQIVPDTHVIVFSDFRDEEFYGESMLAGADYYVLKEDLNAESLASMIMDMFRQHMDT
jgi:pilus assembly protein CpaE